MRQFDRLQVVPLALLLVCGCGSSDDDGDMPPDPEPVPQRGDLIGEPTLVASWSTDELLALVSSNEVTQRLLAEVLTPDCLIDVYHLEYQTEDPAGNITPAPAGLMVPKARTRT